MTILSNFKLDGKTALVTGASKGIGKGIALAFAQAGANVLIAARTEAEVVTTAAEIAKQTGQRVVGVACDVDSEEQRAELLDRCMQKFGRLDVLVNNAGGSKPNNPLKTSAEDFAESLSWNVVPAFDLSKSAVPLMCQNEGGNIINISSAAARLRQPGYSSYGAAKAAVSHLTRLLAQDFAPHVRVNAIEPGAIVTEALERFLTDDIKQGMLNSTPMNRLGTVEDVAASALFLASPAASWITGKIIELDGGMENPPIYRA